MSSVGGVRNNNPPVTEPPVTEPPAAESARTPEKIIANLGAQISPMEEELEGLMAKGAALTTSEMLQIQQLLNQISQLTGLAAADLSKYFEASDKVLNKL